MRRFHEVLTRSTFLFLTWLSALTGLLMFDCTRKELMEDPYHSYFFAVLHLPLYGLVLFGCYALIQIGWHLLTLSKYIHAKLILIADCVDAHKELVG